MLRGLTVGGIKAFELRQEVLLAPLTLVFGANSAGKSTLLQALLLMQQSVLDGIQEDPQLLPRGSAVDLGSYRNVVSRHDEERCVTLGIAASLDEAGRSPLTIGIEATLRLMGGLPRLERTEVTWADDPLVPPRRLSFDARRDVRDSLPPTFELRPNWFDPTVCDWLAGVLGGALATGPWIQARERAGTKDPLDADGIRVACAAMDRQFGINAGRRSASDATGWVPLHRTGSSTRPDVAESAVVRELEWLLDAADSVLRRELECVRSVGPLRQPLPRVGMPRRGNRRHMGRGGEQVLEALVDDEGLRAEVNDWLARLDVGYAIDPVDVSTGQTVDSAAGGDAVLGDVIALRFIEDGSGLAVSPSDVGFGVIQVVPVVVQSLVDAGGTVVIEQPELHLHPRLQAELGELFAARAAETSFVLETHSEHLILRLARLVKSDPAFDATQIRILVVKATDAVVDDGEDGLGEHPEARTRTVVHEIELDDYGRFTTPWPGGFFPDRERELFADEILDTEELTT